MGWRDKLDAAIQKNKEKIVEIVTVENAKKAMSAIAVAAATAAVEKVREEIGKQRERREQFESEPDDVLHRIAKSAEGESELVGAPKLKGDDETFATLFIGATQAGAVVWHVTADYGFTTPSVDAVELVECPEGIEIIQSLAVEIVESNGRFDLSCCFPPHGSADQKLIAAGFL